MTPKLRAVVLVILNFLVALLLLANLLPWSIFLMPRKDGWGFAAFAAYVILASVSTWGVPVLLVCGLVLLKVGRGPHIRLLNGLLPLISAAALGLSVLIIVDPERLFNKMLVYPAFMVELLLLVLVIVTTVASLISLYREAHPNTLPDLTPPDERQYGASEAGSPAAM